MYTILRAHVISKFGVDVGDAGVSNLRIFPIRRTEGNEWVGWGVAAVHYVRKVCDEEKALCLYA